MTDEMTLLKQLERNQDRLIELKQEEAQIEKEKDDQFAVEYQNLVALYKREVLAQPTFVPNGSGGFEIRIQYLINRIR